MASKIEWTRCTDDGDEEEIVELPAKWEICGYCNGEGKHSHALGAITEEDRDRDWSPDEWEDYMGGAYDSRCECCGATGKVLVVDWETLKCSQPDVYQARLEWERDEADYRSLCEMERRMGC